MVVSRRPRKTSAGRRRETLEEKFQRILSEPVGTPIKLSKRESRAFLRWMWENGKPDTGPDGAEIMRRFYGLSDEPEGDALH